MMIGREADLRDVDRQLREQRRADADENVRAQARGLSGELAFDADRAAEQRGEQKLRQDAEPKRLGDRVEGRGAARLRRLAGESDVPWRFAITYELRWGMGGGCVGGRGNFTPRRRGVSTRRSYLAVHFTIAI